MSSELSFLKRTNFFFFFFTFQLALLVSEIFRNGRTDGQNGGQTVGRTVGVNDTIPFLFALLNRFRYNPELAIHA